MARKQPEEWIEVQEAARIISANSGRVSQPVSPDYVRLLAHQGKIRMKPKDGRTNLYLKSDVEAYRVQKRPRKPKEKKQAA